MAFHIHSPANLHKSSQIIVYIMFVFSSDFLLWIHLFPLVIYLSCEHSWISILNKRLNMSLLLFSLFNSSHVQSQSARFFFYIPTLTLINIVVPVIQQFHPQHQKRRPHCQLCTRKTSFNTSNLIFTSNSHSFLPPDQWDQWDQPPDQWDQESSFF